MREGAQWAAARPPASAAAPPPITPAPAAPVLDTSFRGSWLPGSVSAIGRVPPPAAARAPEQIAMPVPVLVSSPPVKVRKEIPVIAASRTGKFVQLFEHSFSYTSDDTCSLAQ